MKYTTQEEKYMAHLKHAKAYQNRRYNKKRELKWLEALQYALTIEGDIADMARELAKKYNISNVKYKGE